MTIAVAIVGLGIMGNRMLASLEMHDGFRVAAAWDPNDDARNKATLDFPEVVVVSGLMDAIEAADVDVVYIACPPKAHAEYVSIAVRAGKSVYCEKPLGVDVAESAALVELLASQGIINAVNFPFAANLQVDYLQAALNGGQLGEVLGVDLHLHFNPWPRDWQSAATWLTKRAEGGYLREVGSHFVFLTERLFGEATLVHSSVSYPDNDEACESSFEAALDCSGVPVRMSGTSLGVGPDVVEFTIHGSHKSIRLSNWSEVYLSDGGPWARQDIADADDRRANNARFFSDLHDMFDGNPSGIATFAEALSVQRLIEVILSSGHGC
ncbi:MAG: Gfo/Idh/MocA family oxidoreductase [Actinobacteria bacterium]|nr:Gfo/Idh/MocA family oxidoreductase [Actinomycetota bacterium]